MNSQDFLNYTLALTILILLIFFIYLIFKINKTLSVILNFLDDLRGTAKGFKLLKDFVLKSKLWKKKFSKLK